MPYGSRRAARPRFSDAKERAQSDAHVTFASSSVHQNTWWLTEDGLTPKHVQVLARLKTLALVQNYSRNFKIEDYTWLDKGPRLIAGNSG